jgi:hypothetical protein
MPNGKRNHSGQSSYLNGKDAEPQAGDEREAWPRERLLAMDRRFRERVERALKMGDENRHAAAATYDANPARATLEVA